MKVNKKPRLSKPLPLKQRTSSVDARRDYNAETWYSVLSLLKLREFFVTTDHFSIWRRHLAWAMEDGKRLREQISQRYASSMVFLSLLLSTELNILFNSSKVAADMRASLQLEEYTRIPFWIGIVIIVSAVLTLLSLISTYTAWCMVSSIHENNAHCIFRSSLGQYVAELPGRLIVGSIYSFLLWVMMFLFVLLPVGFWSIALVTVSGLLFIHTICSLSAFGRVIMHSGAMGHERVFEESFERNLLPHSLHAHLLAKARANLSKGTSILRQYRYSCRPIDHFNSEEEISYYLSASEEGENNREEHEMSSSPGASFDKQDNAYFNSDNFHNDSNLEYSCAEPRKRADSTVRFADEVDLVTSSPSKHYNNQKDNDMVAASGPSTTLSHLTTASSSGKTTDTMIDEPKATINEESGAGAAVVSKPPRPGVVRRKRSNTAAPHDGEFDFNDNRMAKPKSMPPESTPPKPVSSKRYVNRAASDGATSGNGPQSKSSATGINMQGNIRGSSSSSSLPPGLSVLENVAKLQRQWRNSYVENGDSDLYIPEPERRQSVTETATSLQELWVNSSTMAEASSRKEFRRHSSAGEISPSRNPRSSVLHKVPSPPNMSQNLSAEALSSRRGYSAEASGGMSLSLSEEEDEAYRMDYGSFEDLPDSEAAFDGKDDDPWRRANAHATGEKASLLSHDHQLENAATSYMSVVHRKPEPTTRGGNGKAKKQIAM